MKNLPDEELFDQLGSRLRNYREEPDELVWENISIATQSKSRNGLAWVDHTSLGIALASLLFFMTLQPSVMRTDINVTKGEQKSISSQDRTNPIASEINRNNSNSQIGVQNSTSNNEVSFTTTKQVAIQSNDNAKPSFAATPLIELTASKNDLSENETTALSNLQRDELHQELTKPIADSTQMINKAGVDSLASNSDEAIIPNKKKKRSFNFYIALSPSLNYRQVTPLQNDNVVVTQLVSEGIMSGKRLGIALETGLQAQINSSLELYVGLSYYHQNQTLSYQFSHTNGNDIINTDSPMAFKVNVNEHKREVNYQMNNIGLQVGFLYLLKAGPLTQKVGAGLWYQHGLSQKSEGATYDNSQSGYLAYQILYRNEYAFSNHLRLYVQPNFTQSFYTTESLNEPFKLKPYSVGLSLGIIYTLQNK